MTVTSTNQKVQFNGNGSTTVFAYNFKIFAQTDLSVILRSATGAETTQQLTTNYTVSGVGETSGGNVTMGVAPPSGTTLTILRVQPNLQGLDLVPNDPFPAGSMEDALDKLTFMVQTHDEEIGRSIKASKTNVIADSEFTVSATDRANKLFSFDSSGNLSIAQEIGTYRGDWAASTTYAVRDLAKDTSTGNIFICVTAHTSSGSQPLTTNTDAAKWALIVDAASATTSQNAAATSATAAASSATAAASSATAAASSATDAAGSSGASGAATSATAAASSATAAASSATSAASSLSTFQSQYHGAASSDPSSNLSTGDLYFNTSSNSLRVYNGSAWVAAAFDTSGALINTNNLSDVSNAATALTNLGVTSTAAELNQLNDITRGSILYGNASGATARLAKGAAATVLTSDGTDIAWAAAASGGADPVVFPNLASPNNTYTSSGTWSKGSLDDDAYVWFYLCGGGQGGFSDTYPSTSTGGKGGSALLIYGTAGHFDGATYVIGAGGEGSSNSSQNGHVAGYGGNSTITTTSANGSILYAPTTSTWSDSFATDIPNKIMVNAPSSIVAQSTTLVSGRTKTAYDFIFGANSEPTGWSGAETTGNLYAWTNAPPGGSGLYGTNGIFGGGGGGGRIQHGGASTIQPPGGSLYAGAGGAHSSGAGAVPGGGGGGNSANGQAGAGGQGNLRVYHV